jgi:cytosol aminopeptidase
MEGTVLASYNYVKFASRQKELEFAAFRLHDVDDKLIQKAMQKELFAHAQNYARFLADRPANLCTPTYFANFMQDFASKIVRPRHSTPQNLVVDIKDRAWAKEQGMNSFLSVSNGSAQEPKFLIMEYRGHIENGLAVETKPIIFVGKGVTFDSGGISIKPSAGMADMKADMQGAAAVCMAFMATAFSLAPVHLICITPLTENLPSGTATKPGDVVTASNGMTIEIDNTDAEGRLILCDALVYAQKYTPEIIIDVATLTGAIAVALGFPVSGMFSRKDDVAEELLAAGIMAGDRVWRMPLLPEYRAAMDSNVADIKNSSGSRAAGSCTAAAFLNDFVEESVSWVHLDIAGAMQATSEEGALSKGMTGRPVRTLLYWLHNRTG